MTIARREIVAEGADAIYHCMSRCVRAAFLCGWDEYTGRSYEHRREWIRERIKMQAGLFAMEIYAYAVMSNHTHIVLRTRPDRVEAWSDEKVAWHWLSLFPKTRDYGGKRLLPDEAQVGSLAMDPDRISEIRRRLGSVSWFMRCLNEYIARRANHEDQCRGRFWEGRFKCQPLLDESAVLACMAYVDLNPVRAGLASTPEQSEFTSVFDRIATRRERNRRTGVHTVRHSKTHEPGEKKTASPVWLEPLWKTALSGGTPHILPLTEDEYLRLIDRTGRLILEGKGAIPERFGPILDRLNVEADRWVSTVQSYGRLFQRVAGRYDSIRNAARLAGRRWLKGLQAGRTAFT